MYPTGNVKVEHDGVPQRPPAYAHFLIDSLDRYDDNKLGPQEDPYRYLTSWLDGDDPTASNFTIVRNEALMYGYFTRLAITQIQMDYQLPTVLSNFNSTIYMKYTKGATTIQNLVIQLSSGWYTPNQLAAQLQSQIRSALTAAGVANNGFTVTFNPTLYSLAFETNNADLFCFILTPTGLTSTQQLCWIRAQRLLGLTRNQLTPIVGNPTVSAIFANRCPVLIYTSYIDIISKNLTKYQRVKDQDTATVNPRSCVIARLYLTPPNTLQKIQPDDAFGSSPFHICVDYNTPKFIRWNPDEAINNIDLQLLDEYGEELPWETFFPTEYQLTLVASET